MHFDPSPEAMQSEGQYWIPGHYDRIRWWVKQGESVVVRPSLPADAAAGIGLDEDVFWAEVGRLESKVGNEVFAEWIVGRPDLEISVIAAKIEPAVDSYYRELVKRTFAPSDRTVRDSMGPMTDAMLKEFASISPGFTILSDGTKAPIVSSTSEELLALVNVSENVCPMKRSIYAKREQFRCRSTNRP